MFARMLAVGRKNIFSSAVGRKDIFSSAVSAAIRTFSAPAVSAPYMDSCVIRGFKGDILLDGDLFEPLDVYANRFPPLVLIPQNRLITVHPQRQMQVSNHWRPLLRSVLIHSYICKIKGDNIVGAFDLANVGVIKDLNIIGFKQFVRSGGDSSGGYDEFRVFVKELFAKYHNASAIYHLPEWVDFLQRLGGFNDDVLYDPVFMDEAASASLFSDVHRLLRHEGPIRGFYTITADILEDIGKVFTDMKTLSACQTHFLLMNLMGVHSRKKLMYVPRIHPNKCWPNVVPSGSQVVDIHRIAVTHAIESNLQSQLLAQMIRACWKVTHALKLFNSCNTSFPCMAKQ